MVEPGLGCVITPPADRAFSFSLNFLVFLFSLILFLLPSPLPHSSPYLPPPPLPFLKQELQQHDVQELNRILFDAIESSLIGTTREKLTSDLFHGVSVQQV